MAAFITARAMKNIANALIIVFQVLCQHTVHLAHIELISSPNISINATRNIQLINRDETRVVNGYPAIPNQFPHHAVIHVENRDDTWNLCAGSIISKTVILTEAYCVANGVLFKVEVGSIYFLEPAQVAWTRRVRIHPEFQNGNILFNVALLVLTDDVLLFTHPNVQKIDLPPHHFLINADDSDGIQHFVSGFGGDGESGIHAQLRYAKVRILSSYECQLLYPGNNILCTIGYDDGSAEGPCYFDGGAPLIRDVDGKRYQIGLFAIMRDADCHGDAPVGYINLWMFRSWIYDVMADEQH